MRSYLDRLHTMGYVNWDLECWGQYTDFQDNEQYVSRLEPNKGQGPGRNLTLRWDGITFSSSKKYDEKSWQSVFGTVSEDGSKLSFLI